MLHCGQQPFSYFVCLLFSAWHLVYSGFIFIFSFFTANSEIQQPAAAGFGVNNSTLCEPANPNTELEEASKLRRAADWVIVFYAFVTTNNLFHITPFGPLLIQIIV